MNLDAKVAIVTGAGDGIGRAIALAMAAADAHVAVTDINENAAHETVALIAQAGNPDALAIAADVGEVAQINAMVDKAAAHFGPLDIMVNNAGVTRRADIMDLTEEDFDWINRINAKGVFFCRQRAAREMIPRHQGVIINIASIAGRGFAGTTNAIYAASKGCVISLTKIAALQLARYNLNINAVCPGIVATGLIERALATRAEQFTAVPQTFE